MKRLLSFRTAQYLGIITTAIFFQTSCFAQTLVSECDVWIREAEVCLRETNQLTPAKTNSLQSTRSYFTSLSGGDEGSGPRQRLAAQCKAMSAELADLRKAGSRSCTI
jgi:hypothetical protein